MTEVTRTSRTSRPPGGPRRRVRQIGYWLGRLRGFLGRPLREATRDDLTGFAESIAHLKPQSRAGGLCYVARYYQLAGAQRPHPPQPSDGPGPPPGARRARPAQGAHRGGGRPAPARARRAHAPIGLRDRAVLEVSTGPACAARSSSASTSATGSWPRGSCTCGGGSGGRSGSCRLGPTRRRRAGHVPPSRTLTAPRRPPRRRALPHPARRPPPRRRREPPRRVPRRPRPRPTGHAPHAAAQLRDPPAPTGRGRAGGAAAPRAQLDHDDPAVHAPRHRRPARGRPPLPPARADPSDSAG